jgi:hypothetical protein
MNNIYWDAKAGSPVKVQERLGKVPCLLVCLFALLSDSENGGSTFLRNIGLYSVISQNIPVLFTVTSARNSKQTTSPSRTPLHGIIQ